MSKSFLAGLHQVRILLNQWILVALCHFRACRCGFGQKPVRPRRQKKGGCGSALLSRKKEKWSKWIEMDTTWCKGIEMVALFLENTAPVKQTERAHTSTLFECKRSVRGIQAIKGSTWCNHASNAIPCSTNENRRQSSFSSTLISFARTSLGKSATFVNAWHTKLQVESLGLPLCDHSIIKLCH
jgi:hypothetical protein